MERRISRNYHPALNYDTFARTRNVLNLRGEPSGHHHNNSQQQQAKTSQIVFEFDSSRSNRFNYLVDQLKRQSSPVERLAVMQSLMNEFIDDINIREHDDTSDTSIATDQSNYSAQEYFQNICQLNFAENPELANLSNMNSFPPGSRFNGLAGSYIHKPQAIRKPSSSRPASITMPSLSAITQPVVQQPVSHRSQSQSVTKGKKSQPFKLNPGSSFQNYNMHLGQMSQQQQQQQLQQNGGGLPQLNFDPAVEYLSEEDLLKRQNTKERNQKYRERKQVEDPHDYRKRKSEAQKRYLERQKMADPDGYRRKKAEQQKRYMEKKAKDDPKLFFNMRF